MTVTERERQRLFRAAEQTWGQEVAMILAEHLPPGGWSDVATRQDIEALRTELLGELHHETGALRGELHHEIGALRGELHHETGALQKDIGALREHLEFRFESLEHRIFSRMDQRFEQQTRSMLIAFVTSLLAFGSLVLAAATIGQL